MQANCTVVLVRPVPRTSDAASGYDPRSVLTQPDHLGLIYRLSLDTARACEKQIHRDCPDRNRCKWPAVEYLGPSDRGPLPAARPDILVLNDLK